MGTYTESQEDFVNRMNQMIDDGLYYLQQWVNESE